MHGLRSNSGLFWALEKVGVRQPLLILSPMLGTPENAGVRQPLLILSSLLGTPRMEGLHSNSGPFLAPQKG